uniref:Uncharacterized protein n=1 Tax=Parascaris univalens TaxID=6257 RepID=A0A915C6X8_PARUN
MAHNETKIVEAMKTAAIAVVEKVEITLSIVAGQVDIVTAAMDEAVALTTTEIEAEGAVENSDKPAEDEAVDKIVEVVVTTTMAIVAEETVVVVTEIVVASVTAVLNSGSRKSIITGSSIGNSSGRSSSIGSCGSEAALTVVTHNSSRNITLVTSSQK